MSPAAVSAAAFTLLAGAGMAFQLALAGGAPWGAWTMGGRFPGVLPPPMRAAAVAQALFLGLLAAVVVDHARPVPASPSVLPWAVVAVSTLTLVLNTISPSRGERRL